jgi:hypothetical protein
VLYLYVYPTLLARIRPEVEALSRRRRPWPHHAESHCRVVTVGYHFDGWPAALAVTVDPSGEGSGGGGGSVEPAAPAVAAAADAEAPETPGAPYEIRLLKPAA